jgi:putative transposase
MWLLFRLWFHALRALARSREDLVLENLALRHQLEVCRRPRRRVQLTGTDRRIWSALARSWRPWRSAVRFVHPDTVVRWHRTAWRWHWARRSRRRGPGRPRIDAETQALIRRMARENPRWGAVRIVGALRQCGIEVSASTVRVYRRQALRRPPSPGWRTCLRLYAPEIWASDFFTVQTLPFRTLYVFVVISHQRRRIEHWNVTAHPTAPWVWRQVFAATAGSRTPRFWLRDRDTSYGGNFGTRATGIGITAIRTPVRAPQANSIAERVIGTLRRECLDHVLVWNERHLRRVLGEYVRFYNRDRPHRTLGLEPPDGPTPGGTGPIVATPVLGGLQHVYRRAA